MSFEIILIGLCCLFLSLSIFLGWKLYQFSIIIINIEDSIEESLDILNKKYGKMNEILQRPIFFDSIGDCHNAILVVANKLTKNIGTKRDEAEEKDS